MGNELKRMAGGMGCDIVNGDDGLFTARIKRIYAIYVRADNTTIEAVVEDNNNVRTTRTSLSWLSPDSSGALVTLNKGEWIFPDYPLKAIEVGAGSVLVYYSNMFIVK